jgi:hypothetical protein
MTTSQILTELRAYLGQETKRLMAPIAVVLVLLTLLLLFFQGKALVPFIYSRF